MTNIALDTNILLYCHSNTELEKRAKAFSLLRLSPVVSSQVVSEYLNVSKRTMDRFTKKEIMNICCCMLEMCEIQPVVFSTMLLAEKLMTKYDFQIFDNIIVAAAIEAGCDTLYTEDMQNGQIINKKLKLVNPFYKGDVF
jgi:predicted nucleic acid-binding protein